MPFESATNEGSKEGDGLWNLVKDIQFLNFDHSIEQIKPSRFDFPGTSVLSEECADFSKCGLEVIKDYLHIGLINKKTFIEPVKRNRILLLVRPQFVSPRCYQNRELYLAGLKKIKTLVFRVPDSVYLKYSEGNSSLNEIVAAAAILTQVEEWKLLERAVISSFYHLTFDKPTSELCGDIKVWQNYPKENLNTEWKQLLYVCCGPQGFAYLFKRMLKRNWAKIARNSISSDIEGEDYAVFCTGEVVSFLLEWVKLFFKPDRVVKFLEEINSTKPVLGTIEITEKVIAGFTISKPGPKQHRCYECPYETDRKINLQHHLRTHSGDAPFVCDICGSAHKQNILLKWHIIIHHTGDYPFHCKYCGKPFVNQTRMKFHVTVHERKGTVNFQCYKCSYTAKDENTLKEHMPSHAKDPTFECTVCRKLHDSETALTAHLRNHSEDKPFNCHICGKGFLFEHVLRGHYDTHSNSRPVFTCRYCNKNLATINSLRTHEEWKQLLFICCGPQGFAYLFKRMLKRNWAKIARNSISSNIEDDGEVVSLLPEWAKLFFKPDIVVKFLDEINSTKPILSTSQITEKAIADFTISKSCSKNHRCHVCPYETNNNGHLVSHLRIHSGDAPFVCDICGSAYKQNILLKQHVIMHLTGKYPYYCKYCGKPFVNHSNMRFHVTLHEKKGNVKFQCYKCSHTAKDENTLKEHMPSHADDPTFECTVCRKLHDSQTALNAHLRNHSKDKPFNCHICGRGFLFEHALRGHYNTHSDSRTVFTCQYCSKNLATLHSLRTHEATRHGEH